MFALLLTIASLYVCFKLCAFVFKAMWEVTKLMFGLAFLPFLLIGLVLVAVFYLALPVLAVVGVIALIVAISQRSTGYEGGC